MKLFAKLIITVIWTSGLTGSLNAQINFGMAATNGPPLVSIQIHTYEQHQFIHIGAQAFNSSFAALRADYQFMQEASLLSFDGAESFYYAGFGSEFIARKTHKTSDEVYLRIPFGLEMHFKTINSQLFAEISPTFGPTPNFDQELQLSLGMRYIW